MPAHINPDLPSIELHVLNETETDFTIAIVIPKEAIMRHRRFLEALIEAAEGETDA